MPDTDHIWQSAGVGLEPSLVPLGQHVPSSAQKLSNAGSSLECITEMLSKCETLDDCLAGVLQICQVTTNASVALLLRRAPGRDAATISSSKQSFRLTDWPEASQIMSGLLHVADLSTTCGLVPQEVEDYRSLLSAPVAGASGSPMALVLLAIPTDQFSNGDYAFLSCVARVLEHTVARLRPSEGSHSSGPFRCVADVDTADGSLPLSAKDGAFGRIVDWQDKVLGVTNALLGARREDVDTAITDALARTGELANSDRTYVFRRRDPDRVDNTHEWVAPGIEPMIDKLQDMPVEIMDEWQSPLEAGHAVEIPDVEALPLESVVREVLIRQEIKSLLAVPMMRDGTLVGFVGFDSVRRHRNFLQTEVQLLKSVATAISVLIDRAAAEAAAEKASAGLRAKTNRLEATLAAIPELVLELDAEGRFVSFNSGAQLVPALQPETFLGRLPEEVLPVNLATLLRELLRSVAVGDAPKELDYEMIVNDELRSFFATAAPKLNNGLISGYVVVVRDITIRRRQRSELLRLSKIAELTSNLVIVTDAAGRIDWVNPAFERRTGWGLEEVRGKIPGSFLQTPATDKNTTRRIGEAVRLGKPIQAELLNRSRSGEDYWVSKDIQPLVGSNGEIEGFIAVQTDITGLKKSHQKALRDRALAMDASNDGIAISDASGRYTYMNRAHREMFGILPADDIRSFKWQDFCPPDAVAAFIEQEWPKLAAKGTWRGELAGLNRNGDHLQNEVSLTIREDGGLLCIARDISGRLKANLEQSQLREELQLAQRREAIANITAGVAHDLNNIIAVVAGTVGLLEAQFCDNREVLTALARITRGTDIARNLVEGLGRLGKPEAKRTTLGLCALIAQCRELLGTNRLEKYAVAVELTEESQSVWADPTELLQVMVNLALNACEAGPPGVNRVKLNVLSDDAPRPSRPADIGALQDDVDYSYFAVSDTGIGVDPLVKQRMFDRYFTTKGSAGTGLGLPIVASIIGSNLAALWFDSVPGKGSTVTVAWPSGRLTFNEVSRVLPSSFRNIDLSQHNVLIVDDVADVADILAEMIETAGAVAVSVSDPTEACLLLAENPGLWSALVTDLHMPGLSGVEVAKIAGQLDPPVPTVLVTALPERANEYAAAFDLILSKPVDTHCLVEAVKSAICGRVALATDG